MARFMTNSETIKLFEEINSIRRNNKDSDTRKNKKIAMIQEKIFIGLRFLVYNNVKFYRKFPNYDDLVQEGFIGLLKAIRKFNYELFPNFFVYSERWIRHYVKRAASRFDVVYCPNRNRVVYADPSEVGEEELADSPEEEYIIKESVQKVREILNEFSDRDREIVERIFGLNNNNPQTLRDIGPSYDLTYERVRQIKNHVISKLRKNESLNKLY